MECKCKNKNNKNGKIKIAIDRNGNAKKIDEFEIPANEEISRAGFLKISETDIQDTVVNPEGRWNDFLRCQEETKNEDTSQNQPPL